MRPPKTLSIAALFAILASAGCGGGDDDSTGSTAVTETPPALSRAELIAQGDAICAEVNAAIGSAASSTEAGQGTQVPDLYIGMVESIKRLGTPDEDVGYAEFIAAAEELAEIESEVKLATEREDAAAVGEAVARAAPALEAFQSAAGEYGFEDCGEEPTAPTPSGPGSGVAPVEEEGGVEVAPEELEEEAPLEEEAAPEEAAPETGGAGGGIEEAAPEAAAPESGGGSGGVGPG